MRDALDERRGHDDGDTCRRDEVRELRVHHLECLLVADLHHRLATVIGLVVGTLAVLRRRTTTGDAIVDGVQLRERHAEGEQDREQDRHPPSLCTSGRFEQHASSLDRLA